MQPLRLIALLLFLLPGLAQAADCPDGKVLGWDGATCCWPGQNVGPFGCTGKATSCPDGLVPTDEGCSPGNSAAVKRLDYHPALLDPRLAQERAPDTYAVAIQTTKGEIIIDVTREWAPLGADRFYNLVKIGFYDDVAFFRVIDEFMAQLGITGDPVVNGIWREATIEDDPVVKSNLPGFVSFAMSGPNSRTTQIFMNLADNHRLDHMGFPPFGKLRDLGVLESIYNGYGEGAPSGRGPDQGRIQDEGNAYLRAQFPHMDWIESARILGEEPAVRPDPPSDDGALMKLNGTELFVRSLGAGDPIVVVHGGPMLEHGYLLPHLSALAESHELIFYDQRVSGRSAPEVPDGAMRMTDLVADLEALRAAKGHDQIHVMGHSFGGRIAIEYALAHPVRVRSLLLLDPMPPSTALWEEEEAALALSDEVRAKITKIVTSDAYTSGGRVAYTELMRLVFEVQFHDKSLVSDLDFYRPADLEARSERYAGLLPDLKDFDLLPKLAGLQARTLVIYGAAEPAAKISGPSLDEAIPDSTLVLIDESGHFPMVEQPEVFMKTVREFLAK